MAARSMPKILFGIAFCIDNTAAFARRLRLAMDGLMRTVAMCAQWIYTRFMAVEIIRFRGWATTRGFAI